MMLQQRAGEGEVALANEENTMVRSEWDNGLMLLLGLNRFGFRFLQLGQRRFLFSRKFAPV